MLGDHFLQQQQKANDLSDKALSTASESPAPASVQSDTHSSLLSGWYQVYNTSPLVQFKTALWQQGTITYRNVGLWRDNFAVCLVLGFLVGTLFWQVGQDLTGVQTRAGLAMFILLYVGFNCVALCAVLALYRQTYYPQRERFYYHPLCYFSALLLVQVPIVIVEVFLLITPIWGLAGLSGWPIVSNRYWYCFLLLVTFDLTVRAYTVLLHAVTPTPTHNIVALVSTSLMMAMLAGYFIRQNKIPSAWWWVHKISWFTYGQYCAVQAHAVLSS